MYTSRGHNLRLYFVPVAMVENIYFNRRSEEHDLESMSNLERIFDDYQGEWLIFDDMHSAKQHIANTGISDNHYISPIYELEAHRHFPRSQNIPFQMHLNPTDLIQTTISRKDLLSVTIGERYFALNRELLESRVLFLEQTIQQHQQQVEVLTSAVTATKPYWTVTIGSWSLNRPTHFIYGGYSDIPEQENNFVFGQVWQETNGECIWSSCAGGRPVERRSR